METVINSVRFNESELNIKGYYPVYAPGAKAVAYFDTPITPKENLRRAATKSGQVCWMPTQNDALTIAPRIVPDVRAACMVQEHEFLTMDEKMAGAKDYFGVDIEYVPQVGGAMVRPGNPTIRDINDWKEILVFQNPDDWDWEGSSKLNAEYCNTPRALNGCVCCAFFERLISLMDYGNAAMALVDPDQKDAVHSFFEKLCEYYENLIRHYKKYYAIDKILIGDDWGTQKGPAMSINTHREMIQPYVKRVVDYAHSLDIFVELHSCGLNHRLLPSIKETGVDMWIPQIINDVKPMYDEYGEDILFGIFAKPLPEDSTDEDAKNAVEEILSLYDNPKAPVYIQMFFANEAYTRYMYELSRKHFCG